MFMREKLTVSYCCPSVRAAMCDAVYHTIEERGIDLTPIWREPGDKTAHLIHPAFCDS